MKMYRKYIKYMLFAVLLCIVTTGNVFASCAGVKTACKECEYSFTYINKTVNIILRAVDQGNGNIEIDNKTLAGGQGFEFGEFNVYGSSFKPTSGNKLYCPALYYDVQEPIKTSPTAPVVGNNIIKISTNKNSGYLNLSKVTENDNGINLSESTKNTVSCGFTADLYNISKKKVDKQVTFTFDIVDNKLPSKDSTGNYMLSFDDVTASDFISNNTCNYKAYVVCETGQGDPNMPNSNAVNYGDQCTFSKEKKIFTTETEIEDPDNIDKEENNNTAVGAGGLGFGNDVGECKEILDEILDHAQTLFNWLKILAPILVILFGALDFAKATIAMDDKGMKTAMSKFPKRLIAAAALFFLPYLINLVLSLPGIGIEDAVCGIGKVVIKI